MTLVRLAKQHGVTLRQSYTRVGKFALIQHQRYAHAKQFNRASRALKKLRTLLGRVIRDITRKIEGDSGLEAVFAQLLIWRGACASNSSVSADRRSIPCTRRKSNASARVLIPLDVAHHSGMISPGVTRPLLVPIRSRFRLSEGDLDADGEACDAPCAM